MGSCLKLKERCIKLKKTDWLLSIIAAILFVTFFLVFKAHTIPSSSMSPNISAGNYVVVSRWGFGLFEYFGIKTPIKRGSIYVFHRPDVNKLYIKRVIALPNDTVEIDNDKVFVNGKLLVFKALSQSGDEQVGIEQAEGSSYLIQKNKNRPYLYKVKHLMKKGHYFLMGDNRDNSADSRVWGTISRENFIARLVKVIGK